MTARPVQVVCLRLNCSADKPCPQCRARQARVDAPRHVEWFVRTGHCGLCGQPGNYCLCLDGVPCGCRGLHRMGSGIGADPVDVFSAAEVSDGQEQLFGSA